MEMYDLLRPLQLLQILSLCGLLYLLVTSVQVWVLLCVAILFNYLADHIRRHYGGRIDVKRRGVVITGCDTGFGHDAALRLHDDGFTVFAGCLDPTGRGAGKLKARRSRTLHVVPLDVRDDASVEAARAYVDKHLPKQGLWGVINNAGYYVCGDVEWFTVEQYKRVLEVNFFGAVKTIKAFIPLIRKSKGRFVVNGSVRANFSMPGASAYSVTKYGLKVLTSTLRLEMQKFDVTVTQIDPGNFSGATASGSPEKQARWRDKMEEMWHHGTEDAKRDYGKHYLEARLKAETSELCGSAATTAPVIDAMEDALTSCLPLNYYLISGGVGRFSFDYNVFLARFYGVMPTCISDWILTKLTGCDKFPPASDSDKTE